MPKICLSFLPFKPFLELFDEQEPILSLELGDSMHPDSGWVDTRYFEARYGKIRKVKDLKAIPYDFPGLFFAAEIGACRICLKDEGVFEVESKEVSRIEALSERFRRLKAAAPEFSAAGICPCR